MTRNEQIIQAAKQEEKKVGFAPIVKEAKGVNSAYGIGFLEGAKWADEHLIGFENLFGKCVQYPSVKAGIQAHAETYSFNIESELFNQLTKEQQKLWRKEIEQACISGGEMGVELARDPRYKENLELKEEDLDLITAWFDHIAQIADDRMTLTNQRMTDAHALDEIKCLAKDSAEFITKYYKTQKGE